jgi:hypothetical protein
VHLIDSLSRLVLSRAALCHLVPLRPIGCGAITTGPVPYQDLANQGGTDHPTSDTRASSKSLAAIWRQIPIIVKYINRLSSCLGSKIHTNFVSEGP